MMLRLRRRGWKKRPKDLDCAFARASDGRPGRWPGRGGHPIKEAGEPVLAYNSGVAIVARMAVSTYPGTGEEPRLE